MCLFRLCTLQVTRLEVARPLEAGLGSLVLAASMKTPHRFLRSNEIILPPSGVITVPLELTFSLQVGWEVGKQKTTLRKTTLRGQKKKQPKNHSEADTTIPGLWTMDWTVDWTMDWAFLYEMSCLTTIYVVRCLA